jgi:GAF domain-containing protein
MSFETSGSNCADKPHGYAELARQLTALLTGNRHRIANAANAAALLYEALPEVNWLGFYFLEQGELVVGPFQGKPATVRISLGRGVCGRAAARRETIVVQNVHEFPDHIGCDSASNSEIAVPLVVSGELIGVLDVDSPRLARFDAEDRAGLERLAAIYLASVGRDATPEKSAVKEL